MLIVQLQMLKQTHGDRGQFVKYPSRSFSGRARSSVLSTNSYSWCYPDDSFFTPFELEFL